MNKVFTSWSALKVAVQKEMQSAMKETVDKSLLDAEDNVMEFYNSPEGAYKRTGQLGNSPEGEVLGSANSVSGEIRLDTSYIYNPSGRDTKLSMDMRRVVDCWEMVNFGNKLKTM